MELENVVKAIVDKLLPELSPHESMMYFLLFRLSHMEGTCETRIGQRTLAKLYGRGPKMAVPSRAHLARQLQSLEKKGCISIGDTDRFGTLFSVRLPMEIPLVIEKFSNDTSTDLDEDYYTTGGGRQIIFERDNWVCQYCGEVVNKDNATLDHYVPQCNGGGHEKENLRTACLICNSIKSGKTYEQAAPALLENIAKRRCAERKNQ